MGFILLKAQVLSLKPVDFYTDIKASLRTGLEVAVVSGINSQVAKMFCVEQVFDADD